ncbi:MAG: hypothetical protein ABSD72_07325 [Terracidiphilus sp.]|jgi:hypothetical protein
MKFAKPALMLVGCVLLTGLTLTLFAPKTVHALAAALVQVTNTDANPVPTTTAAPVSPFFALLQLSGTGSQSAGPGTGTLGITEIVLTNEDTVVDQVNIYAGLLSSGTCGGTNNVEAATNPFLVVKVQPNSTLVIPLSTPLVFSPETGYDNLPHTCVAAGMPITGGNVIVSFNGFVN